MRPPATLMFRSAALPYVLMLLGAASFAVMAMFTVALKEQVDWQWIAIARTGLAMTFAATMATAAGKRLVFFRPRKLWMRSIAGSVSLVCGFYAMTHYPVSEVLTLTNMFPLWVAVLSLPLLGEWPSLDVWPAVLMGIAGVVLIQQPQFGNGQFDGTQIAVAAAILSSFTSAVALIGLHQVRELDPRAVVVHFSAVALACCVAALFVFPTEHPFSLDWRTAALLLGVGVSATIGQLFLTIAFATGPPARVSVVGLSQVGFTMLLEMLVSQRSFSPLTLVGIGLVILPTAWTLLRGGTQHKTEVVPLPLHKAA
ncbi:MAG TPA: DMT family transporter [Pirellulaceae bacterium]|nr:DMT family transporter [Pirellulaceae bacterium]